MTQHHDDGNKTLQTQKYSVLCLVCHIMPNEIENKLNKMISFLIEQNNILQVDSQKVLLFYSFLIGYDFEYFHCTIL